jgi:hypothetical protein
MGLQRLLVGAQPLHLALADLLARPHDALARQDALAHRVYRSRGAGARRARQ